jgi:hypothetical protein
MNKNQGVFSKEALEEGRFLFLLISLLFLFFIYPFVRGAATKFNILDIFFLVILLSGIYAISHNKRLLAIGLLLALTALGSSVMNYFLMTTTLKIVTACSYGLFFSLLAFITFSQVMKDKKVTTNTLLGAICVYLLFGVIWTMLYHVLEITMPGSFIVSNEDVSRTGGNFLYYSFVTLTTLGYGDITPASSPARSLSSLEAVTGQLYIAILVARLVGLHIVHAGEKE